MNNLFIDDSDDGETGLSGFIPDGNNTPSLVPKEAVDSYNALNNYFLEKQHKHSGGY